jgi:hypothetical protein
MDKQAIFPRLHSYQEIYSTDPLKSSRHRQRSALSGSDHSGRFFRAATGMPIAFLKRLAPHASLTIRCHPVSAGHTRPFGEDKLSV